ncbi:hypothetical protein TFKS16_1340 [Tannerella forsythia KS16]|nr:hypothetical protein TFKS16_1340 [Tannerella forsythia KS16]
MPSIRSVPLSGLSNVPIICSRVVFPAPLGPTMAAISPASIVKSIPFRISSLSKRFLIPRACIIVKITCRLDEVAKVDKIPASDKKKRKNASDDLNACRFVRAIR